MYSFSIMQDNGRQMLAVSDVDGNILITVPISMEQIFALSADTLAYWEGAE